jgi:hypothetical protein
MIIQGGIIAQSLRFLSFRSPAIAYLRSIRSRCRRPVVAGRAHPLVPRLPTALGHGYLLANWIPWMDTYHPVFLFREGKRGGIPAGIFIIIL